MKFLALADQKDRYLWDYYDKDKVKGYDAIFSCGDLPKEYLSLLVTYSGCPLFFVPGNHDDYPDNEPAGCINIDGKLIEFNGLHILGLGGSLRYSNGENQYTEREMKWRYMRLIPRLKKCGVDILVTHAAAFNLGDTSGSRVHGGFKTFRHIIDKYSPKVHLHGHVHLNYGLIDRSLIYKNTHVINAFEKYEFKI